MDIDQISRFALDFYYGHKIVVIVAAVVLVIMVLLKPKAMLKTLAIIAALVVAIYIVTLIGDMIFSGVGLKEKMINQSP